MVLEGELYLIPFALLKGSSSNEYLYERFSLIAVPSIHGLGSSAKVHFLLSVNSCENIQSRSHGVRNDWTAVLRLQCNPCCCALRLTPVAPDQLHVAVSPWQRLWGTLNCLRP